VDVSAIRASSTLRILILGIKFTKSERALNKLQNNNLQREQRNLKKKKNYIRLLKNYVIIKIAKRPLKRK